MNNGPSGLYLRYQIATQDELYSSETYSIMLSRTDTNIESFTEIFTETLNENNANVWQERAVVILNIQYSNVYIAFRHHSSSDQFILKLDNVAIEYTLNEGGDDPLPIKTNLLANYPNPFNPTTTISFDNATEGNVTIEIFNIRGQRIKTLVNDSFDSGTHSIVWDGRDDNDREAASGIYFYKMQTSDYSATRRMILLK